MKLEHPARSANAPPGEQIEVHVTDLKQLFDSMDPSPFRERDLDPHAEEFIVSWAREAPRGAPLTLIVHADRIAELYDRLGAMSLTIADRREGH